MAARSGDFVSASTQPGSPIPAWGWSPIFMCSMSHRRPSCPSHLKPSSPSSFFNLHVEGVGYLNRVRTVKPKKGQEFLACTVAALRGSDSDVSYTKFDCRVSGADAQAIVKRLETMSRPTSP